VEISPWGCGDLYLGVVYAGKQHGVDVFQEGLLGAECVECGGVVHEVGPHAQVYCDFSLLCSGRLAPSLSGDRSWGISFEFLIMLMVQPCEQKRGNYFHMGSLAILVLSTITLTIDESLDVWYFSGTGSIVLIFLLTIWMIVRMKKNSPSVHMLEAVGRSKFGPLPEKLLFDMGLNRFPCCLIFVLEVVATPLIANVVHEWSVDDVCLPLQIWSVAVDVTVGIALWALFSCWECTQRGMYITAFVFVWFISGCVLFSDGACVGEIFAFSVYVMVLVSISILITCFKRLLELCCVCICCVCVLSLA